MKTTKIITLSFILITSQLLFAGTISFKSTDGTTEFSAVGKPAMIKINGKGQGPEGDKVFMSLL